MSLWKDAYIFMAETSVKLPVGGSGDNSKTIKNVPTVSADSVIGNVLNAVYYMIGIAAVIAIIVGGIMYATSGGDSNQITKAKNVILYAVIGVIVTLLAFGITGFVIARVG